MIKLKKILVIIASFLFLNLTYTQTNLIGNGSFEYLSGSLTGYCPTHFTEGYVQCWSQIAGSSDIEPDAGNTYSTVTPFSGSRMTKSEAFDQGTTVNEIIMADINISKDKGYILRFWVNYKGGPNLFYVQLDNTESVVSNCTTFNITTSIGVQNIFSESFNSPGTFSGWQLKQVYFTTNDDYSQIIFFPYNSGPFDPDIVVLIDSVGLVEYCDASLVNDSYNMAGSYYYGEYIEVSDDGSCIPVYSGFPVTEFAHLTAGNYIELLPNFESYISSGGEYFLAEIVPCVPEQTQTCTGGIPILVPEDAFPHNIDYNVRSFSDSFNNVINVSIHSNILSAVLNRDDITIDNYVLYTIDGRVIEQKQNLSESRIEIELLSSGMYVLNILLSDGSSKNFKILLN